MKEGVRGARGTGSVGDGIGEGSGEAQEELEPPACDLHRPCPGLIYTYIRRAARLLSGGAESRDLPLEQEASTGEDGGGASWARGAGGPSSPALVLPRSCASPPSSPSSPAVLARADSGMLAETEDGQEGGEGEGDASAVESDAHQRAPLRKVPGAGPPGGGVDGEGEGLRMSRVTMRFPKATKSCLKVRPRTRLFVYVCVCT